MSPSGARTNSNVRLGTSGHGEVSHPARYRQRTDRLAKPTTLHTHTHKKEIRWPRTATVPLLTLRTATAPCGMYNPKLHTKNMIIAWYAEVDLVKKIIRPPPPTHTHPPHVAFL